MQLTNRFLQLPAADRKAILDSAAQDLGKSPNILEKDVWVCWTLEKLVNMPKVPPLAFKGGTSLSKAFDAIARFSEDVDVTLDRRAFDLSLDPFAATSKTQAKKICAKLDAHLAAYLADDIKPYFDEHLKEELQDATVETKIGDSVDKLHILYPTCLKSGGSSYLQESVLLELGGKNEITPSNQHQLKPYIKEVVPSLAYPLPTVSVLAPERTYWEKATLIHAECNRKNVKANAERLSRHWYDLFQLSRSDIGSAALKNTTLLEEVVDQKQVLYPSGWAKYDDCLGSLRLIPDNPSVKSLEEDFDQMRKNAMFWREPATFQDILEELSKLETTINNLFNKTR
jgi:hypothetical protein